MPEVEHPKVLTRTDIARMTNEVLAILGHADIPTGMGILCNLVGQLVAVKSDNVPSVVQQEVEVAAENIRRAAVAKMLHDDEKRRQDEETIG